MRGWLFYEELRKESEMPEASFDRDRMSLGRSQNTSRAIVKGSARTVERKRNGGGWRPGVTRWQCAVVLHSRPAFGVPSDANRPSFVLAGSDDRQAAAATLL